MHWLTVGPEADPAKGRMRWDPIHSLWNGGMTAATLILGPLTLGWDTATVFVVTTGLVLLVGHSVGYHRLLVHHSFDCPEWLKRVLIWCGALVGLSGPFAIMQAHDMRDSAQRQPRCHPYLHNGGSFWRDYWRSLHCRLELEHPPAFTPPPAMVASRFYRFLQDSWMLHQIPIALALYAIGGLGWVVWGVCARITASVTGHWYVGRLAHREGPQTWLVDGAGVQASDVSWAGLISMGEAWHNNHHAYPGSARIGLYPGQTDLGFVFLQALERIGLVWDVRTPENLPARPELRSVAEQPSPSAPQPDWRPGAA